MRRIEDKKKLWIKLKQLKRKKALVKITGKRFGVRGKRATKRD